MREMNVTQAAGFFNPLGGLGAPAPRPGIRKSHGFWKWLCLFDHFALVLLHQYVGGNILIAFSSFAMRRTRARIRSWRGTPIENAKRVGTIPGSPAN